MPRKWAVIENEALMKEILEKNKWNFDYVYFVRYLVAQRKILNFVLSITRKPDRVLIECPYNMMDMCGLSSGAGIKVVELQHGVVNPIALCLRL